MSWSLRVLSRWSTSWRRLAGGRAALLLSTLLCSAASACELILSEHRSGRELTRVPLAAKAPAARIAFTHSVLGTPVVDHYVWRHSQQGWRAHLVQEQFEGEGYGLPSAAGPGETLVRDGQGWRLRLDRLVHPLVVRPLPAQKMRLQVETRPDLLLGSLSQSAIELRTVHCMSK